MKKLFLLLTAILCFAMTAGAQTLKVQGVVLDGTTNEPLPGATVMPIGGGQGTSTDSDGNFTLTLPANVKQVKVSYVGYETATVNVAPTMTVALQQTNRLNEVVVTGYGSGKKLGSVVGSVSVVGSETFENVPTATFVDALQGQVSGLSIFSGSGDPTSDENSVRLRGVNSLYASNQPLYILDGAPVTSTVFTTLNPQDIESITVLKDASSVAIYGSRAANGVIVITSKKGKFGENARVTLRASYGWSQMTPDNVDMMTSQQYVQYRDLIGMPVSDEVRTVVDKYGINTNWRDEIFNGHAPIYNLDASISGGGEQLGYYLSVNHYESDGIISQSHLRRETVRFSLNARCTDWFRIGLQSNLGFTKYETNNESNATYSSSGIYRSNPMFFARFAFPYDSPYYYTIGENGMPVFGEKAEYLHFTGSATPEAYNKRRSVNRNRVTANLTLWEQINPIAGLTIRAQQNCDAYDSRLSNIGYPKDPLETPMGDVWTWQNSMTGWNQQSFGRYYAFTYTNTAEYARTFGGVHNMTLLAGQESIISKSDSFYAMGDGYTDPRQMLLGQATSITTDDISQSISQTAFNSFFFSGNYNYNDLYFLDASFRRDGSSKFAPDHRWSSFWAIGGMWNVKGEKFMSSYSWIDDLKLHLSYGTTGNSGIGNYAFYGLIGGMSTPYNGVAGIGIAQPANKDLTWETVKSLDLGVNFGFKRLVSGEINFYRKETVDMLLPIPFSFTTGFASGMGNIGNMRNTGIDVDLRFDIIKTKDWYWALRGNFNYNHNEITKLFDGQDKLTIDGAGVQYAVGHNAGEYYQVRWAGIDPRDGQQMWLDKDGNLTKVYNEEQDAVLVGKSMYAPLSGGFGTDIRWKGLSLKVDFNWAAKKYMTNNDRYFLENNNQAMSLNQMASMLNVWTHAGQVTDIPAADGQTLQFDTHLLEDASFMRLKNLTLTYSLPQSILNKIHLRGLSAHFTGRNLLTFTNFTGYDPEPETNVVAFYYPNTRQYEFGIEVSF